MRQLNINPYVFPFRRFLTFPLTRKGKKSPDICTEMVLRVLILQWEVAPFFETEIILLKIVHIAQLYRVCLGSLAVPTIQAYPMQANS